MKKILLQWAIENEMNKLLYVYIDSLCIRKSKCSTMKIAETED